MIQASGNVSGYSGAPAVRISVLRLSRLPDHAVNDPQTAAKSMQFMIRSGIIVSAESPVIHIDVTM